MDFSLHRCLFNRGDVIMTDHHVEPEYGTGKKNFSVYLIGFILCIVLTLIPFNVVHHETLSRAAILWVLVVSALLQFIVQVICFLRLTASTAQGRTNIVSFVSAIVVVIVLVGGSVWIMASLDYHMMH